VASFLLESGFTAVIGLLTGTAVAIWAAYRIAAIQAPGPGGGPAGIVVPGPGIALLLAACCAATLVGTWLPARAAARTRPAEALRCEA
jgi:ABC-type antimicrobial peptide transport system permease subunit